jgi:membrane protein
VTTLKRWWARLQATPVWRAWKRYGDARGNLLAGGVSYVAFLSLIPVLTLAFTVFGLVLRDQPGLIDDIRDAINEQLPGFVKTPGNEDGIISLDVPSGRTLTLTGLVGFGTLLWGGLGWLSATREGIRAMFHAPGAPGNAAMAKLRDLGVLVLIGLGVVLSVVASTVASAVATWLADLVGLGGQGWLFTVVGLVVQLALNTWVVVLLLRLLSGVHLPWPGLRNGAVAGGIGLTLIQVFGTRLVAGTADNPALGAIAIPAALLVFLNFISRVVLVSAAWAANDLDEGAEPLADLSEAQRAKLLEGPAPERVDSVRARTDAGLPTFSARAADRTTLAAGAVLGAFGAVAVGTARRGLRTLFRRR